MSIQEACTIIAQGFEAQGVVVRNMRTGRTIPNAAGAYRWEDVYAWDSHGELWHLVQWLALVAPERIGPDGEIQ